LVATSETGVESSGGESCDEEMEACERPDCSVAECGGLSAYDDDGCPRRRCSGDEDCPEGSVCLLPREWGGCVALQTFCEPTETGCVCASTSDCEGAICIRADEYPLPHDRVESGPMEPAIAESTCTAEEGPTTVLRFGLEQSICGSTPGPGRTLRLSLFGSQFLLQPIGAHRLGRDRGEAWYDLDDDEEVDRNEVIIEGLVRIRERSELALSGDYELVIDDDVLLVGAFREIPMCPSLSTCSAVMPGP